MRLGIYLNWTKPLLHEKYNGVPKKDYNPGAKIRTRRDHGFTHSQKKGPKTLRTRQKVHRKDLIERDKLVQSTVTRCTTGATQYFKRQS